MKTPRFSKKASSLSLGFAAITSLSISVVAGAYAAADEKEVIATPYQIISTAPDSEWRQLDPENTLVLDLPSGEIIIELRPDIAPLHVERIKTLVRQGFYNGLKFHRVIEGFVAQGGDPKGDGTGGSELPNLEPEFFLDTQALGEFTVVGRDRMASRIGFAKGVPMAAEPESLRSFRADKRVLAWTTHCPGVMSMARAAAPNSANSQFFLMIGDARSSLDQRYTAWGLIVDGYENARRINRGEPPDRPTPVIRMRIAADMPVDERPRVEMLQTDGDTFPRYLERAGLVTDGFVKDICNIKAPRRVKGKIEL